MENKFPLWKRVVLLVAVVAIIMVGISLLPRIANRFGYVWMDKFPDKIRYAGHSYAQPYNQPQECQQPQEQESDLIKVGEVKTLFRFDQNYDLFASGKDIQKGILIFSVYIQRDPSCYLYYGLEGGP